MLRRRGRISSIGNSRAYRIDFALTVDLGNMMRYRVLRSFVEQNGTVSAPWHLIRSWLPNDLLRVLAVPLRVRVRPLLDTWPLFLRPTADAVVIQANEGCYQHAPAHWLLRRKSNIVVNNDAWLQSSNNGLGHWALRLALRKTDLFVPWSNWASSLIRQVYPELRDDRVMTMHPGIDLAQLPLREPPQPGPRFRVLFGNGDLMRKGVDALLDAYEQSPATHPRFTSPLNLQGCGPNSRSASQRCRT